MTSTVVPTNAISSFVWTLAGRRPTARTSGLSPRLSGHRRLDDGLSSLLL